MIYLLLYILIVVPFALSPYKIGSTIGKKYGSKVFAIDSEESYWKFVSFVKRRRVYVLVLLGTIFIGVGYGLFYFLNLFEIRYDHAEPERYVFFFACIIFFSYLLYRFSTYRHTIPAGAHHKNFAHFKNIVETISITAGIKAPEVALWAHRTPGIFLTVSLFKQPILCVTTGMLNQCNNIELEAFAAHELGNFITHEVRMRKVVGLLMSFIEIGSLGLFTLFLGSINPTLVLVHFLLLLTAPMYINQYDFLSKNNSNIHRTAFLALNPVYLFVLLVSQSVYYLSTYGETIYADLKAIELTRYPQGLYSALTKMEDVVQKEQLLPEAYTPWFIVGESAIQTDTPFSQASIIDRKILIRSIDPSVTDVHSEKKLLMCPVCTVQFQTMNADELHHINIPVHASKECGYLWFDNSGLYKLSMYHDATLFTKYIEASVAYHKQYMPKNSYECPQCGAALLKTQDPHIPSNIQIYHCSSCKGDLISADDFAHYSTFRNSRK